jgi:tetratricopeptide (TPR) repeat protein
MIKHSYIYLLFIILCSMQGQALAQEKFLHVFVTNTNKSAVGGMSITCARGCSTELVRQGRAKIALPAQTLPNEMITLRLVKRSPSNPEWIIVSPPNGQVYVSAFSNLTINTVPVTVTMKGDRQALSNDKVMRTIIVNAVKEAQLLDGQLSEKEYDLALKMQAKTFGVEPEDVISAIQAWKAKANDPFDKGLAAFLDKDYAKATKLLRESYNIRKRNLEEFIDAAYLLGQSLWQEGKYGESVEKFQEVVVFRKNDSAVLNSLGLALCYDKKYSEAETVYRKALAIDDAEYGKDSVQSAIVLNNLGLVCRLQRKFAESERLYNEALTINRKELGDEAPLTANSLNNLGILYIDSSKYADAERLLKQARAIREKILGKDHIDTAITIDNLGALFIKQGRNDEAEPLLRHALSVKENTLGYEHPLTAYTYSRMGMLYLNQGRYTEAIPHFEKLLVVEIKGGNDDLITDCLNNIAIAYHRQDKYPEAEHHYKRAIDICRKMDPDKCNMTYRNLGKLYTTQGKYAEAEPLFERALELFKKGPGEPSVRIVFVLESYAELLRKTNREEKASALETQAKEIRDKAKFYGKN